MRMVNYWPTWHDSLLTSLSWQASPRIASNPALHQPPEFRYWFFWHSLLPSTIILETWLASDLWLTAAFLSNFRPIEHRPKIDNVYFDACCLGFFKVINHIFVLLLFILSKHHYISLVLGLLNRLPILLSCKRFHALHTTCFNMMFFYILASVWKLKHAMVFVLFTCILIEAVMLFAFQG